MATLNRSKHIKYWLRCLRTYLPQDYTSTDLNRLALAFFCISALDLLGELDSLTTDQERKDWCDWVYKCQLPAPYGGFRGSPATNFEVDEEDHHKKRRNKENGIWDPANLPACYFALAILVALGDDLSRLRKRELLELLPRLQRGDGSFGEWIGEDQSINGGDDMRFVYCAAACRWMLRGDGDEWSNGFGNVKDVDIAAAIAFIQSVITYDNGISAKPFMEAHGGYAYCALGALSLFGCLDTLDTTITHKFIRWLVQRQIPLEEDLDDEGHHKKFDEVTGTQSAPTEEEEAYSLIIAGFSGRCNKKGDTCYSFWVGGALDILGKANLIHKDANRRFLLEKTQHVIGGFGKFPGPRSPPDILHSFMGLAALSIMDEPGLLKIDSALCMSLRAKERLMSMDWWKA